MVDLYGHEPGNGGHSQGRPTAHRDLLYSERWRFCDKAFSRKQKLSLSSGRLLTLWMMRKYRDFGRLSSTSVIQTSCAMLSESSTKCFRNANISSLRRRSKELVYERASAVLIFEFVPRPNTAKSEGLRRRAAHEILPRPFLEWTKSAQAELA